jgi:amidase
LTDGLDRLDATAQAELVRSGEASPSELVEAVLHRIEALDPRLNAFVTVCAEEAEAAVSSNDFPDGPFRGVPIAIKDLTETAGIRTTFSSRAFAEYVPARDPSSVRRIKDAGFVIVGKTNTPEFGVTAVTESELNGECRNPWNLDHTPGGSSGGAAAAVASGMIPLGHGSDGGGSIRIPAACCGLFGLKPSRGRISRAPFGNALAGLSTDGPIAWSVRDAAALLDVLAGYEPGDPFWAPPPERPFAEEVGADPGRLRIAFTMEPAIDYPVDEACLEAAREAAELLTELGHEVVEATPPWRDPELLDLFAVLWQVGPRLYPVDDLSLLTPLNRALAEAGERTPSHVYELTNLRLQAFARGIVAFCLDYDAVLTPALAKPPVPVGWIFEPNDPWEQFRRGGEFTPFTPVVNVTGQPAVSVPMGLTDDGLPLGAQLIGRPADEATLIRLASQLEAARPWADRRPDLAEQPA